MSNNCVKDFFRCYETRLDEYNHDKCLSGNAYSISLLECFPILMEEFDPDKDSSYWVNSYLDPVDDAKITMLMEIVSAGNLDFVKFMVDLGADVNAIGHHGDFALEVAAIEGWQDIFDYLYPLTHKDLQEKAKKELNSSRNIKRRKERDVFCQGSLIQAVEENNSSCLKSLLLLRIDFNGVGKEGKSALHEACRFGYLNLVVMLLDAGADINHEVDGETPLSIARQANQADVVEFLLTKGGIKST